MLESGFTKGGQSQEMVHAGKLPESRGWCSWSRRHCCFVILVLVVLLFCYNTNLKEMAPGWKSTNWWTASPGAKVVPPYRKVVPPYRKVVPPHPTIVSPSTKVVPPHPTIVSPSTKVVPPHPTIVSPSTKVVSPGTTVVSPGTKVVSPGTKVISPGTKVVSPGTKVISPGTKVVSPGTKVVSPGTKVISPGTKVVSPGTKVVSPGTKVVSPGTKVISPGTKVVSPGTKVVSPHPKVVSPGTTGSSTSSPGTGLTGFINETSSPAFPQTENITSSNVTGATTTTLATLQTTSKNSEAPTPVPYKSPGPYVVEYPSEYHFVIDEPKKCEEQKPFLVLMVPVAPSNREHRDVIRETWGGESLVLGKVVKLFFLLGLHAGVGAQQIHEQLLQESRAHGDLIQSDFLDCYKNLTIKTMMMLEWLDSHCPGASYAMKIDSDMFLNVPNLVNMLLNAPKTNYMTGLVARGAAVLRDRRSKWFLPVELYPQAQYPRYALGLGYVLSLDLCKKLVEASRHVKAVYIEDVYLGLCMQHLGIPPTDPPNWGYFQVFPVTYSRCAYSKLIATTTHQHSDRVSAWKDFKRPGPYC